MINNYDDFIAQLLNAGFSMGAGNDEGVFALLSHNWDNTPEDCLLQWHTGDADTDPWVWRMRVLDERDDVAYSKFFFKKSGYITREWYPYFLAARRGGRTFDEAYADGTMSQYAKRIYHAVAENGALPLDEIKRQGGFSRDEKPKFDGALVELQMRLYLTMCGQAQKISQNGGEYGWSSTVFCTTENFWGEDVFRQAAEIDVDEAVEKIAAQVLLLNPTVEEKKIIKFIKG